jgi:hypothetical protein
MFRWKIHGQEAHSEITPPRKTPTVPPMGALKIPSRTLAERPPDARACGDDDLPLRP